MAKQIKARVGEYTDRNTGEVKGIWADIGVILSNDNGEYIMLNPTVDLAGVLMKQRFLAQKTKGKTGDNVMCSIFDNANKQGGGQQQAKQPPAQQQAGPQSNFDDFDDDIPF